MNQSSKSGSESSVEQDREELVAHIHSIFRAYIKEDADVIRRTHSKDWAGFQIKSAGIVRGIDGHMDNAIKTLGAVDTISYELLDVEVQHFGDAAAVYYLARDVVRSKETGEETVLMLRAADIYRREKTGWIQCGSNICLVPGSEAGWQEN